MKIRYKECRTIKTGDYENVKIEYEIEQEQDSKEFNDFQFTSKVRKTLDGIEQVIRKSKEMQKDFQTVVNNWIQDQSSEERTRKVLDLLVSYGVSKLTDLSVNYHEEFVDRMIGETNE